MQTGSGKKYKDKIERGAIFCQDSNKYKKKFFNELATKGTQ